MANVDAPHGFRPIRHKNGAPYNGSCNLYYIPSTDATNTFIGDAVIICTTATKNMTSDGAPYVQQAAATNENIVGVVVGFQPATNADTVYRAGSTARYCYVAPADDIVYEAQVSGYFSATQVWEYADIVVGTGSTITGLSAMEVNSASATTAATCRIVRLSTYPNNVFGSSTTDAAGLNASVEVTFNEHINVHL